MNSKRRAIEELEQAQFDDLEKTSYEGANFIQSRIEKAIEILSEEEVETKESVAEALNFGVPMQGGEGGTITDWEAIKEEHPEDFEEIKACVKYYRLHHCNDDIELPDNIYFAVGVNEWDMTTRAWVELKEILHKEEKQGG